MGSHARGESTDWSRDLGHRCTYKPCLQALELLPGNKVNKNVYTYVPMYTALWPSGDMTSGMPDFVMPQKPGFHIHTYICVRVCVCSCVYMVTLYVCTCTQAVDSPLALFGVSELPPHFSPTDKEGKLKSPF